MFKNRDTLVATMAASISGGVLILFPDGALFRGKRQRQLRQAPRRVDPWRRWRRPSSPWPSRGIGNTVRTSIRPGSRNVRSSSRMRSSSLREGYSGRPCPRIVPRRRTSSSCTRFRREHRRGILDPSADPEEGGAAYEDAERNEVSGGSRRTLWRAYVPGGSGSSSRIPSAG